MSLHDLANQVQSAGRNDDKVLVHMTPGEVKGLQSIAMAHGGSLTINPQTGLPEAGFLSSILPMVAGLGLSMIPGVGPMMAAGIVGGGTAIATGDLKKGLMAGLGAYGGAGLGAGLSSMGAQGAAGTMNGLNVANAGQMGVQANTNMLAGPANFADDAVFANSGLSPLKTGFGSGAGMGVNPAAAGNIGLNTNYAAGTQLNAMLPSASTATAVPTAAPSLNAAITNVPPPAPVLGGPTITTGTGNGVAGFNQSMTPRYLPSDATTTQPFAGGMKITPQGPSVVSEPISRPFTDAMNQMGRGAKEAFSSTKGLGQLYDAMPQGSVIASGLTLAEGLKPEEKTPEKTKSLIRPYEFSYNPTNVSAEPYSGSAERTYFNPVFTAKEPYEAPGAEYAAMGGLMGYAAGGPIEDMAAMNAVGANTGYPMANLQTPMYSNPAMQRPEATNVVAPSADAGVSSYSGELRFARGGMSHLGDYSDGGRLLKGPGDGVSDSIPAVIGQRQPARLADGEFVVPARIVSELGNGSTQAGARKLYAMMDRVQNARKKSVGKKKVAVNSRADKYLPA